MMCKKGSGFILSLIYFQIIAVSPEINDLVDLCPNIWCNNPKAILFLGAILFDVEISFVFTKNECFLCALCGRVTEFFSVSTNYSDLNPL